MLCGVACTAYHIFSNGEKSNPNTRLTIYYYACSSVAQTTVLFRHTTWACCHAVGTARKRISTIAPSVTML